MTTNSICNYDGLHDLQFILYLWRQSCGGNGILIGSCFVDGGCFYFCLYYFAQGALTLSVAILFYSFSNTFSCKQSFFMLRVLLFLCCLWGNKLPSFVSVWWTNIWIKQAKIDSSITSRSPIKKRWVIDCIGIWAILWNLDLSLEGGRDSFCRYSILVF